MSFINFQLEEGSVENHKGERKIRTKEEDDLESVADSIATESDITMETDSVNIDSDNSGDESEEENVDESLQEKMETVKITIKSESENCDKCESNDPDSKESESNDLHSNESENSAKIVKSEQYEEKKQDSDDECMFPDTSITLQHVKGDT